MYDGIGRAVQGAIIVVFFMGGVAAAALYGLVKLAIYICHHLHWVSA